jgi:hypothetical protein
VDSNKAMNVSALSIFRASIGVYRKRGWHTEAEASRGLPADANPTVCYTASFGQTQGHDAAFSAQNRLGVPVSCNHISVQQ